MIDIRNTKKGYIYTFIAAQECEYGNIGLRKKIGMQAGDAYRISRISVQLHQIPARETSSRARNIDALIYRQRPGRTINQPRLIRDNRMHGIDCSVNSLLRSVPYQYSSLSLERKERAVGKREIEREKERDGIKFPRSFNLSTEKSTAKRKMITIGDTESMEASMEDRIEG